MSRIAGHDTYFGGKPTAGFIRKTTVDHHLFLLKYYVPRTFVQNTRINPSPQALKPGALMTAFFITLRPPDLMKNY